MYMDLPGFKINTWASQKGLGPIGAQRLKSITIASFKDL